jgi:hypothetical protein
MIPTHSEPLGYKDGTFIEKTLQNAVENIIERISIECDIEYKDVTYKDVYLKTMQFAKELDEILSSEITGQDNIFSRIPDINSFRK